MPASNCPRIPAAPFQWRSGCPIPRRRRALLSPTRAPLRVVNRVCRERSLVRLVSALPLARRVRSAIRALANVSCLAQTAYLLALARASARAHSEFVWPASAPRSALAPPVRFATRTVARASSASLPATASVIPLGTRSACPDCTAAVAIPTTTAPAATAKRSKVTATIEPRREAGSSERAAPRLNR
jgi:hypothetical protein